MPSCVSSTTGAPRSSRYEIPRRRLQTFRAALSRHRRTLLSRRYLVGELHGLRSRLHRTRGKDSAAFKQPFWPKGVSYVFGTFFKGSLRTVHLYFGGADGIRTHDLLDAIEARSQLRHGPTEPFKFTTAAFARRTTTLCLPVQPTARFTSLTE